MPKLLRHLLLAGADKTVGKSGVRHNNLHYMAPELHGRGGQAVQIRYMPHDDRWIEVYLDGEHLCTAYPRGPAHRRTRRAVRRACQGLKANKQATRPHRRRNRVAYLRAIVTEHGPRKQRNPSAATRFSTTHARILRCAHSE